MATVSRGKTDAFVRRIKRVLDEYEREHPGSAAELYRHEPASIRIRVVDERFAKMPKHDRHDELWNFISARLDDDTIQEISVLLPIAPKERKSLFMSMEFDDPMPSHL